MWGGIGGGGLGKAMGRDRRDGEGIEVVGRDVITV